MALKDLITEKGALDEATIERIVAHYVRYDIDSKEILLLPSFASLSNKAKVFVYLVALQGWKFVTDEPPLSEARPAEIEIATGIPGGSLRPMLRDLSDRRVLMERDSHYSVRATSLSIIEAELNGDNEAAPPSSRVPPRKVKRPTRNRTERPATQGENDDTSTAPTSKKPGRKLVGKTGNITAKFERWIDEGYFDEPKTMADVKKRFHKDAILVSRTSLPRYFLTAVRNGRLTRDELVSNGKTVWAYTTAKKT